MLKVNNILFMLALLFGYNTIAQSQDTLPMQTLFTTAQERQIIDRNRYNEDKPVEKIQTQAEPEQQVVEVEEEVAMEEVSVSYHITGVTANNEDSKTAWVNGKVYESGDVLDDGSKIRIKNTSVHITTPDGKSYSAVSGEVLNLTYLQTIQ